MCFNNDLPAGIALMACFGFLLVLYIETKQVLSLCKNTVFYQKTHLIKAIWKHPTAYYCPYLAIYKMSIIYYVQACKPQPACMCKLFNWTGEAVYS